MAYRAHVYTVPEQGTGVQTLTNHGVLLGAGTSNVNPLAVAATGTVMIGNTGADPSFSATPSVTSLNINSGTTITNFTEGTWTPNLSLVTAGTSSFTYSSRTGRFCKIGNICWIQAYIALSNFTVGTGSGNVRIDNLPFTVRTSTTLNGTPTCSLENITYAALTSWYQGNLVDATTTCTFVGARTATSSLALTSANIGNTSIFKMSGWYPTA